MSESDEAAAAKRENKLVWEVRCQEGEFEFVAWEEKGWG